MQLLLLTAAHSPSAVLPSLGLLSHTVRSVPATVSSFLAAVSGSDATLVDARSNVAAARSLCRQLAAGSTTPIVAVLSEGALVTMNSDWGLADILLTGTGPAELDARIRLVVGRNALRAATDCGDSITFGELVIDDYTYAAWLRGRPLDLTYTEYELLKFLVLRAGRAVSRAELLREVWGCEFFGGTKTVDVHIRRLRAKLSTEHESMIGTVRNVGYKAVRPVSASLRLVPNYVPPAQSVEPGEDEAIG